MSAPAKWEYRKVSPGRVARGPAGWLRHRGPADPADQAQVAPPAVRDGQSRRRSRGVPLSANPVAAPVSFRGGPSAGSRRADGATALFQLGRYRYQVFVTNLSLQPLWRFYNDRAGVELLIRQLKGGYALGSIPTRHFFANELYFHLLLLAYNLVNWFKRLCLPPEFQTATLQTLRHKVLLMPAQLRRVENRPSLALPASGPREAAWKYALDHIKRLRPCSRHFTPDSGYKLVPEVRLRIPAER